MARLLVLRGDSLEQEIRLTGGTVRIGRGQDNDLVLDDPGRSVSRDHAEIRCEDGRYVIYDLGSQNGVWGASGRAPSIPLDPDVVANIGPFRLMVDQTDSGYHAGPASDAAGGGETRYQEPEAMPRGGGAPPRATPAGAPGFMAQHGKWVVGGAAALVIGGIAFGMAQLLRTPSEPEIPARLQRAAALLSAGDCARALEELDPIVTAEPSDAAAQKLKAQAEACLAKGGGRTGTTMTAEQIDAHLAAARQKIQSGDCDAARTDHLQPILAADPSNADALVLSSQANDCPRSPPRGGAIGGQSGAPDAGTQPPPPSDCPGPVARPTPPEQGGLVPNRCESPRDYTARMQAMNRRYEEAVAAQSAGQNARAAAMLDSIVNEAGNRYRDAATRLGDVRRKDAGATAYKAAQELEGRNELARAQAEYRRAHELDPSRNVEADIARVAEQRKQIGEAACKKATAAYAYRDTPIAQREYETVVKMLPPDHECVAKAKELFPHLRK